MAQFSFFLVLINNTYHVQSPGQIEKSERAVSRTEPATETTTTARKGLSL